MRRLVAVVGLVLLGTSLLAASAGAATGVASRLQLRGHLPELGERPAMRVFQTQVAYDSFRTSLGEANVFPASSNMFMSFDRDILALYIRGNDTGGRCLRTGPSATLDGDTTTLDLLFEPGTCGAPSGAHYPFILSPAPTAAASPSPTPAATTVPTATATASATASRTPVPSTAAPASAVPTAAVSTSPVPTRSVVAVASPSASASAAPSPAGGSNDFLLTAGLVGLGILIGIVIMAARRPRRSIRRIP
jgi:hypothetical protein